MYKNVAFGTAKSVLFIEVSSFQGVLIREVPLYVYTSTGNTLYPTECLHSLPPTVKVNIYLACMPIPLFTAVKINSQFM